MKSWSQLCPVHSGPLAQWVEAGVRWKDGGNGIKRVWQTPKPDCDTIPAFLLKPILEEVLAHFPLSKEWDLSINKVAPGFVHGMHVDWQIKPPWVTRIHVPLETNPDAWHRFESDMEKVHFAVGFAYTFDAEARHDFANEGNTDRTHLIFDVHRIL